MEYIVDNYADDRRVGADRADDRPSRPTEGQVEARQAGRRASWRPGTTLDSCTAGALGGAGLHGLGAPRRRSRRGVIRVTPVRRARSSRSLTTVGDRRCAAARDDQLLRRGRSPTSSSAPSGRRCSSRPHSASCRWSSALFLITGIAHRRGDPARPRLPRSTSRSTRRPRVRKVVKPVLEILAGVPTIVFGYFALTFFTPDDPARRPRARRRGLQRARRRGSSWASWSCRRSPRSPRTRCRRCPQGLREGAYGLGAVASCRSRSGSSFPAALSGIVAALVLGGLARDRRDDDRPDRRRPAAELASTRAALRDDGRVHRRDRARATSPPARSSTRRSSWSASTLFVLTLVLNLVSIRLVRKYREVYE